MRDVHTGFGAELAEFTGEPGHLHLLLKLPPTTAISRLVNSRNGVSSGDCSANSPVCAATTGGQSAMAWLLLRRIGRRCLGLRHAPVH